MVDSDQTLRTLIVEGAAKAEEVVTAKSSSKAINENKAPRTTGNLLTTQNPTLYPPLLLSKLRAKLSCALRALNDFLGTSSLLEIKLRNYAHLCSDVAGHLRAIRKIA